jgi:hypothetical protein
VRQQSPASLQTIAADAVVAQKANSPSVTTPAVSRCFIVDLLLFFGRGLKTLRRQNGSSSLKQTEATAGTPTLFVYSGFLLGTYSGLPLF